jgi:hypothetical protein
VITLHASFSLVDEPDAPLSFAASLGGSRPRPAVTFGDELRLDDSIAYIYAME